MGNWKWESRASLIRFASQSPTSLGPLLGGDTMAEILSECIKLSNRLNWHISVVTDCWLEWHFFFLLLHLWSKYTPVLWTHKWKRNVNKERNRLQSLKIENHIFPKYFVALHEQFELLSSFDFGCHMAINYTHLATGLPCYEIWPFYVIFFSLQVDFAYLFLLYFTHIWQLIFTMFWGFTNFIWCNWPFFLSCNHLVSFFSPGARVFVFHFPCSFATGPSTF